MTDCSAYALYVGGAMVAFSFGGYMAYSVYADLVHLTTSAAGATAFMGIPQQHAQHCLASATLLMPSFPLRAVPSFRHFRLLNIVSVFGTTFAAM